MARGVNKVILVGNLGNDPEMKYTQGGMAICTLSVATTSVRKDKDGNPQERTEWHRVKLFGKLGEIAGEYLKKARRRSRWSASCCGTDAPARRSIWRGTTRTPSGSWPPRTRRWRGGGDIRTRRSPICWAARTTPR
jgi:hypothetical protein